MSTPAKIELENLPTIALVGRVNVGKSTLFNKLIEQDKAITSQVPGTTRTNNEGLVLWRGKYFRLIDTGGLTFTDNIPLEKDILAQTERAMKEADIIIFVADAKDGILPQEKELAKRIRRIEIKPVIFVANKVDNTRLELNLTEPEWSRLGLGEPIAISAANGRNVGDFLDILHKQLNKLKKRPKIKMTKNSHPINVAIIGKPNVGKSSLFNKLIGQDKVIVSDLAHTTREPHDVLVDYTYEAEGKTKKEMITFVDTAGIRRKSKVAGQLEREGIFKSINAVKKADIILFVIDGSDAISSQDKQLAGLLEKNIKSVITIINKWDLTEDNSDTYRNEVKRMIYAQFPHLSFAPVILVSGKTGYKVHDIFPLIIKAWEARQTIIDAKVLSKFIDYITKQHLPSRGKGTRQPKIIGFKQLEYNPPVFEATIKFRTSLHRSYLSFIENKLREQFNFFATPLMIKLTKSKRT